MVKVKKHSRCKVKTCDNLFDDPDFYKLDNPKNTITFWYKYIQTDKRDMFKDILNKLFPAYLKVSQILEFNTCLTHIYMCVRFVHKRYKKDYKILKRVVTMLGHPPDGNLFHSVESISSSMQIGHVAIIQDAIPTLQEAFELLSKKVPSNKPIKDDLLFFECGLVELIASSLSSKFPRKFMNHACENAAQILDCLEVRKNSSSGEGLNRRIASYVKKNQHITYYCMSTLHKYFCR